jgi:hypothetical protein
MEWGWAGEYPIFVYMRWLDHNLWKVKVIKGEKGNQNAEGYGPNATAWFEYISKMNSRYEVCKETIRISKKKIVND